jgi:hypothetical protein
MRRAIVILAFVAAVLGALAIRVVVEGRGALAEGDELLARGRTAEAIRAYESAARWYLPLALHVDTAYEKLRMIAEQGTRSSSALTPSSRLAAWRSIRSAARATRWLVTPHADDLAAADAAIASISAGLPGAATADPAWHAERLARDSRPSIGACVLASFGILLCREARSPSRRGVRDRQPGRDGVLGRRPLQRLSACVCLRRRRPRRQWLRI